MHVELETNSEKFVIKRIIEILEQDGEEKTDGECIDEIINWLQFNGYKILGF